MNGSPYRTPQPSDRRIINRSGAEQPQRQPEEPVREEPLAQRPVATRQPEPPKQRSSKRGIVVTIVIVLILALVAAGAWFFMGKQGGASAIDSGKYQAVFLSNGQAYLGKLEDFNDESFRITNVYLADSPQASQDEATTEGAAENSINLVPVTGSVHGPEDEMIIMKDQVLFYENLREDSQAARLIDQNAR